MGMVADALGADTNLTKMSDAVTITAYSSIMLGASICGIGIFKANIFPKVLSSLFTLVAGLSCLLLATADTTDLDTNSFLIPVFLSVHLLTAILGIVGSMA